MKKRILSIILKLLTIISSTVGVLVLVMLPAPWGGAHNLFYFTLQSNIWIAICCLVGLVLLCIEIARKKQIIKRWMFVTKMIFTICITVTGFVFCCVLAPTMPEMAWNLPNVLLHIATPIFAIADFFIFDTQAQFEKKDWVWVNIPFGYYIAFATVGYLLKWDFGAGLHYPYFFMNYGSPAGLFGFSSELPYMGSVYWLVLFAGAVIGLTFLYIWIANKINKNNKTYIKKI